MVRWKWRICVFVFACVAASSAFAQPFRWSPPDKSFTIEVPVKLKKVKGGYSESSDPNAVTTFGAQRKKYAFMVLILKYAEYATESAEDKFGGLFFVIGGDDDHEFTKRNIRVDGLTAQEIIYDKRGNKGVFIDAGDTVYVLGMFVKDRGDLDLPVAKRFFNSFRLKRPVRRKINK